MFSFLRNKIVLVLVVLVILGAVLGAAHNRAMESGTQFPLSNVVRTVLVPVDVTCRYTVRAGGWVVRLIRPRGRIQRENVALRKEVRRLALENHMLRHAADENTRLRLQLGLRQSTRLKMVGAEIISRKGSGWFDTATIDHGRRSGITRGSAVVTYRGLVGQVVEADTATSQISALTDPSSNVGGTVVRSRISGIVQGQGADYLVLAYLPKDADVREKDVVVSSGMGRVIPKGFPIGRVVKVVRNSLAGTTSALVRPSVRLEQVEQVFVIEPGEGAR